MLSQRFFKHVESKSGLIFDFGLFSFKCMNFFKTRQSDYPEYTSLKNWIGSPQNTVLTSLICHHHSKSPTSPLFDAMILWGKMGCTAHNYYLSMELIGSFILLSIGDSTGRRHDTAIIFYSENLKLLKKHEM